MDFFCLFVLLVFLTILSLILPDFLAFVCLHECTHACVYVGACKKEYLTFAFL